MNKIGPIRAPRSKQQAQLKLFLKPLARFASLFIDLQVLCPGGALIGVYIFVPRYCNSHSAPCCLSSPSGGYGNPPYGIVT